MNWISDLLLELSIKQKEIDLYIHKKNNLNNNDTFKKRIIALFTEISEFINEVRTFKYWSTKEESSRNIILEEYIDCIHFLLSIGNDINFDWKNYNFQYINIFNLNELILESYINLSFFTKSINVSNFKKFLDNFLNIIVLKKISKEEFHQAYISKNKINYKRQENNY